MPEIESSGKKLTALRIFGLTSGCRRRQRLRLSSATQTMPLAERRMGIVSSRCCELTSTCTSSSSSSATSIAIRAVLIAATVGSARELSPVEASARAGSIPGIGDSARKLSTLVTASTNKPHFARCLAVELDDGCDLACIGSGLEADLGCGLAPSVRASQQPLAALAGERVGEPGFMGDRFLVAGQTQLEIGDLDVRIALIDRRQPDGTVGLALRRPG